MLAAGGGMSALSCTCKLVALLRMYCTVLYCTVLYCVTPVCVLRENHRARRS